MMRAAIIIAVLALATPATAREPLERVPFVGCPSDGQAGPILPPKPSKTPKLPRQIARQLAFYGYEAGPGALAPRGWHCIGIYGSNGEFLVVTPERHKAAEFFRDEDVPIRGPAVQLSVSLGGTSGRLSVMPAIVRYFPRYRPFVRKMKDMELDFGALDARPFKSDVIRRRTSNYLRFKTPAGKKGEGTNSRLLPGKLPIEGVRKIEGLAGEPDLIGADVRLPQTLAHLVDTILAEAAK